ncbi:DNA fragmentation factor-related protein 2 isoform X2 [Rhynchophorus ferrugineus]|uniref:DNA fragmentation factor-related protein 2 isoform X2 n=1 Tax=Rhynchophorus ferrugineus TaxID=354439 RepID=UPI003FCC292E
MYYISCLYRIVVDDARGKRPFKLWDGQRSVRKGLVVGSLEELVARGRDKLGVAASEPVRLVLESDGTQVEDAEYFRTLPPNSVLLLLRPGERWLPAGVDVIRAVSAIPRIVCETINALELQDETPSWKIMDNKGRVTVVLHWDQRPGRGPADVPSPAKFSPSKRPPGGVQTAAPKGPPSSQDGFTPPRRASPQITVINHDEVRPMGARRAGSLEAPVHVHTPECMHHAHLPRAGSPQNGAVECDFHCCALHEEGRRIAVHKSVATSPIQEAGAQQAQASPQPRHVRFLDVEGGGRGGGLSEHESSESETENTVMEDEAVTSEKFLLLIDQLSVDQKRHLSIKDIGIILERLSSKILDVERLDRESESDDCYNWTIKQAGHANDAHLRGNLWLKCQTNLIFPSGGGSFFNGRYVVLDSLQYLKPQKGYGMH